MTLACEVIECLPAHLTGLAAMLRPDDLAEVTATGLSARSALWRSYRASHIRRTFIVDGTLAAVGGCSGSLLSPVGCPWMLTSPMVERVPLSFVKEARREMDRMLEVHPVLANFVAARYTRAIRLLELLGFRIGDESEGMRVGPGAELFLKFEMVR